MPWKNTLYRACFLGAMLTLGNSVMATAPDQFKTTVDVEPLETANSSLRKPQMVIVHYTAGDDKASQHWLTEGNVSSNYLVKSDARIAQIVPDGRRAWHAGGASWKGLTDLNSLSLGVEITGWGFDGEHVPASVDRSPCVKLPGAEQHWFPFPEEQFEAIAALLVDFDRRWKIKPQFFIGHSDVAPGRKVDPGPLFPWERLHEEYRIGAWPDLEKELRFASLPEPGNELLWTQLRLRDYGYGCPLTGELDKETVSTIQSFQMHFRPTLIDGNPDEETRLRLAHLVDQYHYTHS